MHFNLCVHSNQFKCVAIQIPLTIGIVDLERASFLSKTSVSLLDNLGRTVKSLAAPSGKTRIRYDLRGLSPNVYYLMIAIKGAVVQKKITLTL